MVAQWTNSPLNTVDDEKVDTLFQRQILKYS